MEPFSSCSTSLRQVGKQSMEHLHFFKRELIQEANVLIVENNPDCRHFSEVLFQSYGASVMACGSIKEALASLESCVPDIVICGIRFPG